MSPPLVFENTFSRSDISIGVPGEEPDGSLGQPLCLSEPDESDVGSDDETIAELTYDPVYNKKNINGLLQMD